MGTTAAAGRAGDRTGDRPEDVTATRDRDGPLRRCVVSGETYPKASLIRFVVAPDGVVVPDLAHRLPGRGLYVHADATTLARATAGGGKAPLARAAARSAGRAVTVADDLAGRVAVLQTRRVAELVALARGAGQVVAGYEKVRGWLTSGKAALLIAARDGAEDGRRRLAALAGTCPVISPLDAAALGRALGRDMAVHAAVAPGGLARRIIEEGRLLEQLCRTEADG